jgi:alkylated DNA nucleotide flippase Atl1
VDHLLEVDGATASRVPVTSLRQAGLWERQHLQEWVIEHPEVLGEGILVVTSEYNRWAAEIDGTPARDRLDILGLDSDGQLVVVEIKRGDAERDIHLQAITYAAMASRFTPETLAEAHRDFLGRKGRTLPLDECRDLLDAHVSGGLDQDVIRRPRQVLIARSFPKQVTQTAVWLSEMNVRIDLVQVSLWQVGDRLVAGFSKVYPTPVAEEFTLAPARQETDAAIRRVNDRTRARNVVHTLVDAGLLPDGTRLRLAASHGTTDSIRVAIDEWVAADSRRGWVRWRNTTSKPLVWDFDGQPYSPTGLANQIYTAVTDRRPDGIQGTRWWVVDDETLDGAETLANRTLVQLAPEAAGGPRDWTDLHDILAAIPPGRWTTYGDLATAVNTAAQPLGQHLANCSECTGPWRVLTSKGEVNLGFRWSDPTRTDTPADVLRQEGVRSSDGIADATQKLTAEELADLAR